MTQQTDLFGRELPQGELLRASSVPPRAIVNADTVRAKMLAILGQLRAAQIMPWPERKMQINRVIFPRMANWLSEDEAKQLQFEFEQEMQRLLRAA